MNINSAYNNSVQSSNNNNSNNNEEDDDDDIPTASYNIISNNVVTNNSNSNRFDVIPRSDILQQQQPRNNNNNLSEINNHTNIVQATSNSSYVINSTASRNITPQTSTTRRRSSTPRTSITASVLRSNNSCSSFSNMPGTDTLPVGRGAIPMASYNVVNNNDNVAIPIASAQIVSTSNNVSNNLLTTSTPIATTVSHNTNQNVVDLSELYQRSFNGTYLKENGFPDGLIQTIKDNHETVLKRYWVIDNSGSMLRADSHRLLVTSENRREGDARRSLKANASFGFLSCTRWRELQQCLLLHIETAAHTGLNTTFKLLNKPGFGRNKVTKFCIANDPKSDAVKDTELARDLIMNAEPHGTSPLTRALAEIREEIQVLAPYLHQIDKKVYVIISTDGLPTKHGQTSPEATNEFLAELRALELYPVWIIIRLCSSDEETTSFYKGLDNELERNVDVVLTLSNEMREVRAVNSWLNYTYPLQYCREIGSHIRLLDLLNERPLTLDEVITMCKIMFGNQIIADLPDPHVCWKSFSMGLGHILENQEVMWNPHSNRLEKQINLKELNRRYGSRVGGGGGLIRTGSGSRDRIHTSSNNIHQQESGSSKCTCTIS